MTIIRTMPTPFRFVIWFFLALGVTFGIDLLGRFLGQSAYKFDILITLQAACNVLLGLPFGLFRFQTLGQIGVSLLVAIFAIAMQYILITLAIVFTIGYCAMAHGHAGQYACSM
jgi:hypothetical protein